MKEGIQTKKTGHNSYNHYDEEANYVLTDYIYNDYSESIGKINLKANCLFHEPPDGLQDWKRLGELE